MHIEDATSKITDSAPKSISLTKVHEMYHALKSAGAPSITIDSASLIPSFKGSDWFIIDYSDSEIHSLAEGYSSTTEIMNGVKIVPIASKKPIIKYNRKMEIVDLPYDNTDNTFGIKKLSSGEPYSANWANVSTGGIGYGYHYLDSSAVVDNFITYVTSLKEAGLHPNQAGNPTPLHNIYMIGNPDLNVSSNGFLDLAKAYEAASALGRFAIISGTAVSKNFNGATYLGLNDTTSQSSGERKIGGKHNPAYKSNISVKMLNYLRKTLGVQEFINTNIIGAGKDFVRDEGSDGDDVTLNLTNSSLVGNMYDHGNFGTLDGLRFYGNYRGVIDIEGAAPYEIINPEGTNTGYLILHSVPNRMAFDEFSVVKPMVNKNEIGNVGANLGGLSTRLNAAPDAMLFDSWYNAVNLGAAVKQFRHPSYKAYLVNGTTTYKLAGDNGGTWNGAWDSTPGEFGAYGSYISEQVPPLDEASWATAALTHEKPDYYADFTDAKNRGVATFDNLAALNSEVPANSPVAIAPANTAIRLASAKAPAAANDRIAIFTMPADKDGRRETTVMKNGRLLEAVLAKSSENQRA
jgi:hypothetical protein